MNFAFLGYLIVLFTTISYALTRGGRSEKLGAVVLLTMIAAQFVSRWAVTKSYAHVDLAFLTSDLIGLVGFGLITLGTNRFWPIWATSLQLLCCAAQFAKLLQPEAHGLVYALMTTVPSGLVVLVLLVGTMAYARRKASKTPTRTFLLSRKGG